MEPEGKFIADQIKRMLEAMRRELEGLPDDVLNRELEFSPSNTLFQLGTHVAGSTRFWTITNTGGQDFHRDRDSEFVSHGRGADLLADLDLLIEQVFARVSTMSAEDLDRPGAIQGVSFSFWPADRPLPQRHSVLHALEHVGLHVGHAQITRQLLGYSPPAGED